MVISDRFRTASNNKSLESEEKDHQQNESYLVQKAQDNTRPNNANCKNGLFLAWRIFGDHSRSSQCPAWRMSPIRSPENSSQEQWGSVGSVHKHLETMYIMYTSQSIKIKRLIYIHVMSCHVLSSWLGMWSHVLSKISSWVRTRCILAVWRGQWPNRKSSIQPVHNHVIIF